MGQEQTSIYLSNYGNIALYRSYVCGNYNSTHYYAQNNVTGNYELISTGATQTISYAVSKLSSGRTWQETVLLKGTFSIGTTITISQANVLLDCRQATLTSTASIVLDVRSANVTILGGHWIGQVNSCIQIAGSNTIGVVVDAIDAQHLGILLGYGETYATIRNCILHDISGGCMSINGVGGVPGYNIIQNCTFYNITGTSSIFFQEQGASHNQIIDCEFYNIHNHAIYFDYISGSDGGSIITGCYFHDSLASNTACAQIKTPNNIIYNNTIENWSTIAFSVYSELAGYQANNNEFYGNTFTNVSIAFWVGKGNSVNMPTNDNKIHDNTFTNVTKCIALNAAVDSGPSTQHVDDTWIYYNKFVSCSDIFPTTNSDGATLIANTVIAYNDFGGTVTNLSIETYNNTMVYGNIGMSDFNVPSPLPIPPRA